MQLAVERVELLDADERAVLDLVLVAVGLEVVVDLAGTEDDALRTLLGDLFVVEDGAELVVGEVTDLGDAVFVAQQALGRHDDERLFEFAFHLAAQHVEELCRCGEVTDLDVVFSAGLQEALEARGGVLRSLALRSRAAGA